MEAGDFYRNVGLGLADALVGLDMVSGVVRDTYEAVTGKNLITGEELDDFSRGFAVLGIVTFGLGSKIGKGVKLLNKICKDERLLGSSGRVAEKLADATLNVKKWGVWGDLPKVTREGRDFAKIGDRLYTKHAVDRMVPTGFGTSAGAGGVSGRGIPPMVVENVIENGIKLSEQIVGGVARQTWKMGTVQVVTESSGKLIITVMRVGQ